jgi:hypothetical protein
MERDVFRPERLPFHPECNPFRSERRPFQVERNAFRVEEFPPAGRRLVFTTIRYQFMRLRANVNASVPLGKAPVASGH